MLSSTLSIHNIDKVFITGIQQESRTGCVRTLVIKSKDGNRQEFTLFADKSEQLAVNLVPSTIDTIG